MSEPPSCVGCERLLQRLEAAQARVTALEAVVGVAGWGLKALAQDAAEIVSQMETIMPDAVGSRQRAVGSGEQLEPPSAYCLLPIPEGEP